MQGTATLEPSSPLNVILIRSADRQLLQLPQPAEPLDVPPQQQPPPPLLDAPPVLEEAEGEVGRHATKRRRRAPSASAVPEPRPQQRRPKPKGRKMQRLATVGDYNATGVRFTLERGSLRLTIQVAWKTDTVAKHRLAGELDFAP